MNKKDKILKELEEKIFDFHIRGCKITGGVVQEGCKKQQKELLNDISKALDSMREETIREVEEKIRKAKTNLDKSGDNKYWINEGVLRCQIIINNLKTKYE